MDNRELGRLGEDAACALLEAKGYRIAERNYRCSLGEIDIICGDGEEIVFVEVKTRRSENCGCPADAVTDSKLRHMRRAAGHYLTHHVRGRFPVRFDVVEVEFQHLKGVL